LIARSCGSAALDPDAGDRASWADGKTLYLLSYLDDEDLPPAHPDAVERGESRHGGQVGSHGQRRRGPPTLSRGQESTRGAGLVVNVVVLWNTLYMDAALAHLRRQSVETKPEDSSASPPWAREHQTSWGGIRSRVGFHRRGELPTAARSTGERRCGWPNAA